MESVAKLQRCPRCHEIKKESQFRYIKYFDEHRTICKRCEALRRRGRKRFIEKHVQEHGVTPGILERLHRQTNAKGDKLARDAVLDQLPQNEKRIYLLGQLAYPLCGIATLCLTIWLWGSKPDEFLTRWVTLLLADVVATSATIFFYRHVKAVDSQITRQYRLIREPLFQDAIRERIEYERFYTSPEWKILREIFLCSRKKVNGRYICDLCGNAIWLKRDLTIDHIKPRSKFPELAMNIGNLWIACRNCNSSKGDKILTEEGIALILKRTKKADD